MDAKLTKIYEISDLNNLRQLFISREIKKDIQEVLFVQLENIELQNYFLLALEEFGIKDQFEIVFIIGSPFTGEGSREGDYENIHVGIPYHWKLEQFYPHAQNFIFLRSHKLTDFCLKTLPKQV